MMSRPDIFNFATRQHPDLFGSQPSATSSPTSLVMESPLAVQHQLIDQHPTQYMNDGRWMIDPGTRALYHPSSIDYQSIATSSSSPYSVTAAMAAEQEMLVGIYPPLRGYGSPLLLDPHLVPPQQHFTDDDHNNSRIMIEDNHIHHHPPYPTGAAGWYEMFTPEGECVLMPVAYDQSSPYHNYHHPRPASPSSACRG